MQSTNVHKNINNIPQSPRWNANSNTVTPSPFEDEKGTTAEKVSPEVRTNGRTDGRGDGASLTRRRCTTPRTVTPLPRRRRGRRLPLLRSTALPAPRRIMLRRRRRRLRRRQLMLRHLPAMPAARRMRHNAAPRSTPASGKAFGTSPLLGLTEISDLANSSFNSLANSLFA